MKVLIVERDLTLLDTMREICTEENLSPVITSNCSEAGKLLTNGYLPDVIICDEFLPFLTGEKWQHELSQHKEWKDIPFILMRGYKKDGKDLKSTELLKPFSIDDMLELFRKVRLSSQTRT